MEKKEKVGFKNKMKNFFVNLKGRFKAFFNKEYLSYSAHKYWAFTALQVKEVFSKDRIEKLVQTDAQNGKEKKAKKTPEFLKKLGNLPQFHLIYIIASCVSALISIITIIIWFATPVKTSLIGLVIFFLVVSFIYVTLILVLEIIKHRNKKLNEKNPERLEAIKAKKLERKENRSNRAAKRKQNRASVATRDRVIAIVAPIARFVVVFAIAFVLLTLNNLFGIIQKISIYHFFVFFTAVIVVLQLLSSISSCTKSYYIAEDNKVLITFPSSGGSLFLSKLTVEFIKELKSTIGLYLPATLGILLFTAVSNPLAPFPLFSVFWAVIPIVILCIIISLLGSLLSMFYLQYLRLVKTFPIIRIIVLSAIFGLIVFLTVKVINLIPENIELMLMWNNIRAGIDGFLKSFEKYAYPITFFCSIICGVRGTSYKGYKLKGICFGRFVILFLIAIALFFVVFIIIKKLFLHMMTKSVDYEKVNEKVEHHNHMHHQHTTFAFKELKISFRTLEISGSYVVTYVLIPVMILLLCRIFDAINTSMKGNMLSIMFILLLIVLPLLASNTPISSAYSREGHAGYIKKTKPIKPYTPMLSKLLFNLVLSVPSIFAAMFIVGKFGKIDVVSTLLLGFSVLMVQYAHIFFSSTLDFTKPRNESYQTEGQDAKNPNENTATVVAFVMAFIFAFAVFFFFNEQVKLKSPTFVKATIRLFFISLATLASSVTLYFLKLKAFFMER